jgi:hypothetical protein
MKPELAVVARKQRGVFWRRQAVAAGYSEVEIDRLLRRRTWTKVRYGIYTALAYDEKRARSDREMHLLAAAARLLAVGGDIVLSHQSAAVCHGIELLDAWPKEPTVTLCRGPDRVAGHGYAVAPVPSSHRIGKVTSPARTVVDCARTLSIPAGFVTAESAVRAGLDPLAIAAVLDDCAGWPGIVQARELFAFADGFSETALESLERLWCRDNGLPVAHQQRSVRTRKGSFVAEVDFVWDEYRTVLETDGRKKYDSAAGADKDAAREEKGVLWREKLREDQLRDCGLEVVRGYWSDGEDGGAALAERLRRAFARGLGATADREYVLGPPLRPVFRPLAEAAGPVVPLRSEVGRRISCDPGRARSPEVFGKACGSSLLSWWGPPCSDSWGARGRGGSGPSRPPTACCPP